MAFVIVRHTRAGGGAWILLGGLAVALFTGLLAALCWPAWRDATRSLGWAPSTCTITASRTYSISGKAPQLQLDVSYTYPVGGRLLASDRWSFFGRYLPMMYTRRQLYAFEERYAPGSALACFVDPADEREAVLDRSRPERFTHFVLTLGGLDLAGAALFVVGVRQSVRARADRQP